MKEENEVKKENKLGFIVLTLSVTICIIAVSYAVWTQVYMGTQENKINTATLILELDESESEGISLTNAIPVTDAKGLTYDAYTFKIKNSGTTDANYKISLINDDDKYTSDGCSANKLAWSNIKYSFSKNDEEAIMGLLSDDNGVLNLGTIKAKETDSYSLKLWIKSSATNEIMNQHFHGVIKVEAIQSDQILTK